MVLERAVKEVLVWLTEERILPDRATKWADRQRDGISGVDIDLTTRRSKSHFTAIPRELGEEDMDASYAVSPKVRTDY